MLAYVVNNSLHIMALCAPVWILAPGLRWLFIGCIVLYIYCYCFRWWLWLWLWFLAVAVIYSRNKKSPRVWGLSYFLFIGYLVTISTNSIIIHIAMNQRIKLFSNQLNPLSFLLALLYNWPGCG